MSKKYDFIIIGSGIGGLMSAFVLSKYGYSVCLLEKNNKLGGTLQAYKRNGRMLGTGMHYIGSLDKGQMMHSIFKYFGLFDGIEYQRMDENGFDIFNIAGQEIKYPMGLNNLRTQFYEYFPNDKEAVDQYISGLVRTVKQQNVYSLKEPEKAESWEKGALAESAWEFICSLTENEDLRNALAALNYVYAGRKEVTPFYNHALINYYFISSSYRIVGSSQLMADRLAEQIKDFGGTILNRQEVEQFVFDDKYLTGVKTKTGDTFYADNFISNAHPTTTMKWIPEGKIKKSYRKRMSKLKNTLPAFSLHLILKSDTVKYRNYNYSYYKNKDVWYASSYDEKNWPEHYLIHFPPKTKDPEFVDDVTILTHMKYAEVEKWKDLPLKRRGVEYEAFKKEKAEKLLDFVAEKFPEFKENLESYYVATPLAFKDYLGTPTGSMYGKERDYQRPLESTISHRTKIPNLYLTGQNLNLHGMLGVSLSSLITTGEFVGLKKLLKEVRETF
jgi:all-trans-retinol 13,14-reductase